MGAYYVGLDVHSQFSAFVIQDDTGAMVARGTVPTTPEGSPGCVGPTSSRSAPWWRSKPGRRASTSPAC